MAMKLSTDDLIVWYYDDRNVTGGYVLLDSDDPPTIQRVQNALTSVGLLCRKQGACFRLAHNRKMYKTFIRVAKPSGDSPERAEIRAAIRALPNAHYDASPVEIRAYFNGLREKIDQKDEEIKGSLVISGVHNYLIFQANKAYPDRSRWIRWNKCLTFTIP